MKNILWLLIVISSVWSSIGTATYYRTPEQTLQTFQQLVQYYDSEVYMRDIENKTRQARAYLARRITTRKNAKFALVLDIDETALSNFEALKRMSFTENPEAMASAFLLGDAPAIAPVLELYQYAHTNNVDIFFICDRPLLPEMVAATVKNLRQAGYSGWQNIFFRPVNNDKLSTLDFKKNARKQISNEDYHIVLNIGDQNSDIEGGYGEVSIKLPNPFYVTLF